MRLSKKTILFDMEAGTVTVGEQSYTLMKRSLGFVLLDTLYRVKKQGGGKVNWQDLYKSLYGEAPESSDFVMLYENISRCLAVIQCEDLVGYFGDRFYVSRDYEIRRVGRNNYKKKSRKKNLLLIMREAKMALTAAEIAQHIGVSKKTITNDMKPLLEAGKVSTVGIGRATRYVLHETTY